MLIPLLLTLTRIPLALAFFYTPATFHIFICAAAIISDILDGWLARRWDQTSSLGGALDPLCDKIFAWSALLVLFKTGPLSSLVLFSLLFRDFILLLYAALYIIKRKSFLDVPWGSLFWGKIITTIQMYSFILILLGYPLCEEHYHLAALYIANLAFALELHRIAFPAMSQKVYKQVETTK